MNSSQKSDQTLLPERYPTQDFFIADVFDTLPVKNDMASMEHPIFSLSTKPDTNTFVYEYGGVKVSIIPSVKGRPTIFDKDILLYCASVLMNEYNKNPDRVPPRKLRISSHDYLVATNKSTGGRSYSLLKSGLDRLKGVALKTNIKTNKKEITRSFGLIDSYEIVESSRVKERMVKLEITLSEWFYNAIIGKEVLTINRDYFRLRKTTERRIYEIARKHCGNSPAWDISLEKLSTKTGTSSSLAKFRSVIRDIIKQDHIPDYSFSLRDGDIVHVTRKSNKKSKLSIIEDPEQTQKKSSFDSIPKISPETIEMAKDIVENSDTGWKFHEIHMQFTIAMTEDGFRPGNVNQAFIGFVKKKLTQKVQKSQQYEMF